MMDGFRRLDLAQRTAKAMVDSFQLHLPQRAGQSGLLPRFKLLNEQADKLVAEYLHVLDSYDYDAGASAQQLTAAQAAFRSVGPRLATHADALDQLLLDYEGELTRIGAVVSKGRGLQEVSDALARRAGAAATSLTGNGFRSPEVDDLLGRVKAAASEVSTWEAAQGLPALEAGNGRLERLVVELEELARDLPQRAARLDQRRRSLDTVLQSVEFRRERVADDLAALRREFSIGNWDDLNDGERRIGDGLTGVRSRLARYDAAGAEPIGARLQMLDDVRAALDVVEELVDAPRDRIELLRTIRRDPEALISRVRFRLRDAQRMVTSSQRSGVQPVVAALDRLAVRTDALRAKVSGAHPDFWAVHREAESIERAVREQVDHVRTLLAP